MKSEIELIEIDIVGLKKRFSTAEVCIQISEAGHTY